ncbi:MAG: DUF5666 domain-containing protein [Acidobacteriaceae bacterium]
MNTISKHSRRPYASHSLAGVLVVASALSAALLAGCSGATPSSVVSPMVKATNVPVLLTDSPSTQLLSFELTVSSITLTNTAGKTFTVLSKPARIEATHLNGVSEPLLTLALPQDTYTSAAIGYSNPEVTYLNATNTPVEYSNTNSGSVTVNFAAPIAVSTTALSLSVELLLSQSVTIAGNTVTINPQFNVTSLPVAAQPTNEDNGKVDGVKGAISALNASANSVTVQTSDGASLIVAVNSSTQYDGISGFSALGVGMLVEMDLATQTDGSELATRIHVEDASTHDELEGPVVKIVGNPATSLQMVLRQELGNDLSSSNLGTVYTVAVDSNTDFNMSNRFGEDRTFPFAAIFNSSTIFAGQNVTAVVPKVSGTDATATMVTLQQQPVSGTVSAIASSGGYSVYTVTLAPTDFLATLTGLTTVNVYVGSNAQMVNAAPITVGSTARFQGLLFNSGGTLSMISGQVNNGENHGKDN